MQEFEYRKIGLEQDLNWAMWCHLSALLACWIPMAQFLGPFIIWLSRHKDSLLVDEHGKAAMNYNLSIIVYTILFVLLIFFIPNDWVRIILAGVYLLWMLASPIFIIMAAYRAKKGKRFVYPLAIEFFKPRPRY